MVVEKEQSFNLFSLITFGGTAKDYLADPSSYAPLGQVNLTYIFLYQSIDPQYFFGIHPLSLAISWLSPNYPHASSSIHFELSNC